MLIDHIDFRRERPEDFDAIDELHRQAFGEEDVTRLVRALRAAEANLAPFPSSRRRMIVSSATSC